MATVAKKSLLALTAGDLMTENVVCIPHNMSVRDAAGLLVRSSIAGAPVIDAEGKCLGMFSAIDFLRLADHSGQGTSLEKLPLTEVRQLMTADTVLVDRSTSIRRIARMMIDAHIHRVVVVGEEDRPVGIVSSTDLLAALAYAEDA